MDHTQYLKANARGYSDINTVCKDIAKLTKSYKELRPRIEVFTHNNGAQQSLINLLGTIPVFYKGRQYNIPIRIVVFDKHPAIAPYVFVTPTATMLIRQGRHVDANGKVYLPYLSDWKKGRSDLKGLAEIMCTVFGSEPPVVAKSNSAPARPAQPPQVQTQQPYPAHGQPAQPYPGYPPHSTPSYPGYPPSQPGHQYQPPPYPPVTQPSHQGGYPQYPTQPPVYPPQPPPQPVQPTSSTNQYQNHSNDTIGQDIMLDSLRTAVGDSIKRRTAEMESELKYELDTLRQTESELQQGRNRINEIRSMVQSETTSVESSIKDLEMKTSKLNAELSSLESNSKIDPQEIIQPSTPLYKQIFNAHAREQALEDSIYHLNKALGRDTIDCDTFLRFVRIFAREQFEQKETVMKAREAARLRD